MRLLAIGGVLALVGIVAALLLWRDPGVAVSAPRSTAADPTSGLEVSGVESSGGGISADADLEAAGATFVAHPDEVFETIGELVVDDGPLHWTGERPLEPTLLDATVKLGSTQSASPGAESGNDYDFPQVELTDAGLVMVIPDAPVPGRSSRRLLAAGSGAEVRRGDDVQLRYDMYSWSTGALVESSDAALGGDLAVTLGDRIRQIPEYLEKSLLGRKLGSRVQVVLGQRESDLPDHLNPYDGYVVVVDVLPPGEQPAARASQPLGTLGP